MNKKELFNSVLSLEEKTKEINEEMREVKQNLAKIIEENYLLKIENERLRHHIEQAKYGKDEKVVKSGDTPRPRVDIGEGYDNLARIYLEGFHICHLHFGRPRQEEECLFCMDLLNKK